MKSTSELKHADDRYDIDYENLKNKLLRLDKEAREEKLTDFDVAEKLQDKLTGEELNLMLNGMLKEFKLDEAADQIQVDNQ